MRVTHFIAQHLLQSQGTDHGSCCLCAATAENMKLKKDVISSSFTDWGKIRYNTKHICPACADCLSNTALGGKALRSYSVIVTPEALKISTRVELAEAIMTSPATEHIIIVNYSMKKHAFFHAAINQPNSETAVVGTDKGRVDIERKQFAACWQRAKKLYMGGFSKADIELGNTQKYAKIEAYGAKEYYEDMRVLDIIRETETLRVLMHLLQKDMEEQ
jgi:hypothetical protein